jgi:Tfp pilus assembly protein PilF
MSDLRIAIEAHQKNNLPLAKQLYQQHLHKFKNDANANQLLAVIFLGEGDIVTAISHLQLSLKVVPKQPHVWCNLAVCFNRQGRTEQAIACYEKALSYDKKKMSLLIKI